MSIQNVHQLINSVNSRLPQNNKKIYQSFLPENGSGWKRWQSYTFYKYSIF